MRFMDKDSLPVEIKDNELPKEDGMNYKMFYDYKKRTNGGFADALFLVAIMITCFMWGMIVIILG